MRKRKSQEIGMPGESPGWLVDRTPEEEVMARYRDRYRHDVRLLVHGARVHNVPLEPFIELVRAEWKAETEA